MKKAQASIEFIFAIGALILIFLILFYFVFERRMELNIAEGMLSDKDDCSKIATAITMAFSSKSSHTFKINSNATVSSLSRAVEAGNSNYPCTFPVVVSNASGNVIYLSKGNINVAYVDGKVQVQNA
ncbi:MAG: hypothetical protein QME12_06970 [Nanoarchaeota archaeon]|nr:hypothetical protein [Nanoarchaeota archaeon]